ncbi:MAG: hypothetical protein JXA22_03210 [Candidatus Thermoplasmatota archaeon]|nr:hypothetical protein [Candidatus Thermoplasmatota archaeon]
MRILHVNNQASVGYLLSRAQRKLGHTSDLLAVRKETQRPPDKEASGVKDIFLKLLKLARDYDLIHVHGGVGISGAGLLPLKAANKRFFAHYHGSELRENIQTSFHFVCERLFISTPDLLRYRANVGDRELIHIPNPVLIDGVSPVDWISREAGLSEDGPLRIAHLPTRREVKGTDNVIRGVEQARAQGARIDLDIIEGVFVDEAMRRLENAHICIDWMSPNYDIHGVVSIEAMVREIPTVCNIDRSLYPEEIPIIPSRPGELGRTLMGLWEKRQELPRIGRSSREYALKVHDPMAAARRIEEYL